MDDLIEFPSCRPKINELLDVNNICRYYRALNVVEHKWDNCLIFKLMDLFWRSGFSVTVTILRDTVTTSWSADDICFLILNISCWSDILVLYVFSSTLPVLACYSNFHASKRRWKKSVISLTSGIAGSYWGRAYVGYKLLI